MELSELLSEIRARCPNNYLRTQEECGRLIMKYASPIILRKKYKNNAELKSAALAAIYCLLLDGDLPDEKDDVLVKAVELIESFEV
jgi:hypothetical protein